jgi:hypothetical protein
MPIWAAAEQAGGLGIVERIDRFVEFFKYVEFDLPETALEWSLYGGGVLAVIVLSVLLYVWDSAALSGFWKSWLMFLRIAALLTLVVVATNPHHRKPITSFRPSQVALLVDTSLSMRFGETMPQAGTPAPEAPEIRSRAEAVKALLSGSPLIEKLREQHEVSLYTFDSTLNRKHHVFQPKHDATASTAPAETSQNQTGQDKPLDWDTWLQPRGLETRLGESLLKAIRELSGPSLSGIVIFTDGGSNAGIEPATAHEVARSLQVRLITVGLGSTQQPVNLQVAKIRAPTDVHIGDAYEFSAFIQAQGMAGRGVNVELLMRSEGDEDVEPTVVETREVEIREDGIPVEVKFQQLPTVAGSVEFFVRALPTSQIRELSDEDNERRKTVNVIERKTRVLLIAGGPMRDYRFVRTMLFRHPAISVDVWLQTVDPVFAGQVSQESDKLLIEFPSTKADLFEYDVIIGFDPDWKRIAPTQLQLLVDWVDRQAGGLILVAGDVHTPELASSTEELKAILELYPVFLNPYLFDFHYEKSSNQAWRVDLTLAGREAGFLQLTDDPATSAGTWKEFPGIYRCYPTGGEKAGATTYAFFSDPRSQTDFGLPILLASQFYGSGRTLYLGSAEIWRLRALDEDYYDRFWTKAIREVGRGRLKRGTQRGMLLLERNQYVLGQNVRVQAHLLNPQIEPLDIDSVIMEVFDPSGKPLIPAQELLRDKNRPGHYIGNFRAGIPGTYRIEVPIPESKDQLVSKIDVVLPNLESDNPRQNAKLLTDLVRDTGGRSLQLAEAEKELPALLPNRGEEFLIDERLRPLWDRMWVLYLLVGLLSLEWLTRKLLKLA